MPWPWPAPAFFFQDKKNFSFYLFVHAYRHRFMLKKIDIYFLNLIFSNPIKQKLMSLTFYMFFSFFLFCNFIYLFFIICLILGFNTYPKPTLYNMFYVNLNKKEEILFLLHGAGDHMGFSNNPNG